MKDDLVDRLEKKAKYTDATFSNSSLGQLYREAATTIRTLRARLDAVREEDGERWDCGNVGWCNAEGHCTRHDPAIRERSGHD